MKAPQGSWRQLLVFGGLVSLLALVWMGVRVADARLDWEEKIDTAVMETASREGQTEFLVFLKDQADLQGARRLASKTEKGAYVYARLTRIAQRTQAPLVAYLDASEASYRRYWVSNMVWVRGDAQVLEQLARRPEVERIVANPTVQLDRLPQADEGRNGVEATSGVEWNISLTKAPDVWAQGVDGAGVVIGGQDTGYDWQHPALQSQYRGWNGSTADHAYNWHDAIHADLPGTVTGNPCGFNSVQPCDDGTHGTHTMGTMVGDDGLENQVGMAPGAQWIGCRNMEQGVGTPATYAECYEWFIAPYPPGGDPFSDGDPARAPHVISNSWTCPPSEGCTDPNVLRTVVNNVRAAGIVTVHAAGNSGSSCSSISTPAAIYDASFTVAATDSSDMIAGFSSRGPVVLGDNTPAKPDISAPGVSVRSTIPGGSYSYKSGTSMATPHVAGLVALLIAAQPELAGDVDAIEAVIKETAVARYSSEGCGGDAPTSLPNHTYGSGRIDAYAAFLAATTTEPQPTPTSTAVPTGEVGPPTATPEWNAAFSNYAPVWLDR